MPLAGGRRPPLSAGPPGIVIKAVNWDLGFARGPFSASRRGFQKCIKSLLRVHNVNDIWIKSA